MYTYRGILTIGIGSRLAYADIDPPQLKGNCLRLVGVSLAQDSIGETANNNVAFMASVKAVPRTTYAVGSDGIPPDALVLASLYSPQQGATSREVMDILKDGFLFGEAYLSQFPYALDRLRVLAYALDANVAGAAYNLGYELHMEEVKLTNEIQQDLLVKAYT
jgi:hypothetical protein